MTTTCLAIIGTAGRRDDSARLTSGLYQAMEAVTRDAITEWRVDRLISGGAAVADHLAVRAYLRGDVRELTLALPAPFRDGAFVETRAGSQDPGAISNYYHRRFRQTTGVDGLAEIRAAVAKGAHVSVHAGFFARNAVVAAAASHVLAFTFGQDRAADLFTTDEPDMFQAGDPGFATAAKAGLKDGGTAHTWNAARAARIKRHVDLSRLLDHVRTIAP